jgi:hypothetical protein
MERLPASVQAMATSGSFTLQAVDQKLDPIRAFLSPQITLQPFIATEFGSLSAQAQGFGNLTYQWMRDGAPVAGGTSAQLFAQGLQSGTYTVLVSNGFAGVMSGTIQFSALPDLVFVAGGTLPSSSAYGAVPVGALLIGKKEVTWSDWQTVSAWAVDKGYTDLANKGQGVGDNYPVTHVSWYDVVKWCNARSEKEGKTPVPRRSCNLPNWNRIKYSGAFLDERISFAEFKRVGVCGEGRKADERVLV